MDTRKFLSIVALMCLVQLIAVISGQKSLSKLPCRSNVRSGKIVGGVNAQRGSTPYIVSLTRRGGHFCGASILNENYLVTAGHCLCNGLNRIMKPNQIKAVVGLHKISEFKNEISRSEAEKQRPVEMSVKNFIVHPEYDCDKVANDIALIELSEEIIFRKDVTPICVASERAAIQEGAAGLVSGWGWTNEDQNKGDRADNLQQASVEFWDNSKCTDSFRNQKKQIEISPSQVCAGKATGGVDSCFADSGGPLINDQNVIVGIVSTGIGCARPGLPGVYTRISEYSDWIETAMKR